MTDEKRRPRQPDSDTHSPGVPPPVGPDEPATGDVYTRSTEGGSVTGPGFGSVVTPPGEGGIMTRPEEETEEENG